MSDDEKDTPSGTETGGGDVNLPPVGSDAKTLSGEIDLLGSEPLATIEAVDWFVGETRQGWKGFASVNPGPGEDLLPEEVFNRTYTTQGFAPGMPIQLGLWGRPAGDYSELPPERGKDVDHIRSWPSVITGVLCPVDLEEGTDDTGAMILFSDPVTSLLEVPVRGLFVDRSPGELLAGGLMLASGTEGEPTLKPVIAGLPTIVIEESLSADVERIPYAVAVGEKLGTWLGRVFGRLGVRMEMLGNEQGALEITLRTGEPVGSMLSFTLDTAFPSATDAVTLNFTLSSSSSEKRAALLDNPTVGQPRRIGDAPTVARLFSAAGLTLDDAVARLTRSRAVGDLNRSEIGVVTRQPGLHPGRVVQFNKPVTGASDWQVNGVSHASNDGRYRNEAKLLKLGVWTPVSPPDSGMIVVAGAIHDPDAEAEGATVARDELSRLPVRLCISQNTKAPVEGESADVEDTLPPPEVKLPVATPMAGGLHGFVPAHRHGDLCQIAVHHPMAADIIGFSYADHRRVAEDAVNVSMGVLVEYGGETDWTGVVFRPKDDVDEEQKDRDRDWRQGKG